MTYIEQAITEAVAQGYDPQLDEIPEAAGFSTVQIAIAMKSDVFLDPAFWQALGRARRWTIDDDFKHWQGTITEWKARYWKTHWHNFIDHLAMGNDSESFFEQLAKNASTKN
jgi:hypothetical protein